MAVYLLFLRYGPTTLIKCIHGICVAKAIEENSQLLLEYVNVLQKHEKAVYRMLRVAATISKDDEDVTKAYTVVEKVDLKKKMKLEDLGNIGTSKGAVSTSC